MRCFKVGCNPRLFIWGVPMPSSNPYCKESVSVSVSLSLCMSLSLSLSLSLSFSVSVSVSLMRCKTSCVAATHARTHHLLERDMRAHFLSKHCAYQTDSRPRPSHESRAEQKDKEDRLGRSFPYSEDGSQRWMDVREWSQRQKKCRSRLVKAPSNHALRLPHCSLVTFALVGHTSEPREISCRIA